MAYSTAVDVQALIPKWGLTDSTKPTLGQVALLIAQVDGRISSILAGFGLTVPFVAGSGNGEPEFAAFLKALSAQGAAVLTLAAMFPDQDEGDGGSLATLKELYEAALEELTNGNVIPPGLLDAASASPSAYSTRAPDANEDIGTLAEPKFNRGMSTEW